MAYTRNQIDKAIDELIKLFKKGELTVPKEITEISVDFIKRLRKTKGKTLLKQLI